MALTVEGTGAKPTLVPQWVSADLDLPGVAVVANGVILILANGDRGSTLVSGGGGRGGGRGGFGPVANAQNDPDAAAAALSAAGGRGAVGGSGGGRGGRGGFSAAGGSGAAGGRGGRSGGRGGNALEASIPGNERDAAWRAINTQKAGQRYSGGRDTTHAVLYALDPQTGDELYSSGDAIDSWNHYGGIAVSDGVVYLSSWDARVYALGIKR
jgi:hypothetical protein